MVDNVHEADLLTGIDDILGDFLSAGLIAGLPPEREADYRDHHCCRGFDEMIVESIYEEERSRLRILSTSHGQLRMLWKCFVLLRLLHLSKIILEY